MLLVFLRVHFFPHEVNFVSYKRRTIRHFGKHTNCPHEGGNNSLKNSGIACLPSMTLDQLAKVMNTNAKLRNHEKLQHSQSEMESTPTWSSLQVGHDIISNTFNLFTQQWAGKDLLECFKINGYQWKVIEKLRCQDEKVFNSIKPEWVIVRLVTYVNGIMKCSCCHFEQHGYMCSCIACVLDTLPKYPGPTHHDFAVSHWQVYMYYSTPSTVEEIKKYTFIKMPLIWM